MNNFYNNPQSNIQCGPGWNTLIEETLKKLPPEVKIQLIKEKFGRLSFHLTPDSYHDHKLEEILFSAEKESSNICELCGKSKVGNPEGVSDVTTEYYIDGSWLRTLCKECRDTENALRIPKQIIDRKIIDTYKKAISKNACKV